MKLSLSETLEGLVAAKAERLGISVQDALRMLAVQWVQDEPLPVPQRVPQGSLAVPGGTYKEGVLAVSSPDSPVPGSLLPAETGKEGSSGGGVVGHGGGEPVQGEKRKRDRRRAVEVPPPILPESLAVVPGLPEALLAFADFRRTSKHGPMTERAWTLLYNALSRFAGQHARLAVEWARAKGWATWEPGYTQGTDWATIRSVLGEDAPPATPPAAEAPRVPRHKYDLDYAALACADAECWEVLNDPLALAQGRDFQERWLGRMVAMERDVPGLQQVARDLSDERERLRAETADPAALAGGGAGGAGSAAVGSPARGRGSPAADPGELLF